MIDCIKELLEGKHQQATAKDSRLWDKKSKMAVVVQLPENGIIIDVSEKAHIEKIIREQPGHKQSCDKMILIPKKNTMDVYFIEMKKKLTLGSLGERQGPCDQILCTTPFLDYLISMVKVHCGPWGPKKKKIKINKYYVVIAEKLSSKYDKQRVRSKAIQRYEHKKEIFRVIQSTSTGPIPLAQLR